MYIKNKNKIEKMEKHNEESLHGVSFNWVWALVPIKIINFFIF